MKRLVLLVLVFLFPRPTYPCGDKYLVRCVVNRADAVAPGHELGHVVIVNESPTVQRLVDLGIQNELTARGFKVYVVRSQEELAEVITDTRLDLAIIDFHNVDRFTGALTRGTSILPVIDKSFASELPALREKYAYILKVPGQKSTSLTTIDLAVRDAR
jgi:hypothetical protein